MTSPHISPGLLEYIAAKRVTPFVGSGLSRTVRRRRDGAPAFPSWEELLNQIADKIKEEWSHKPHYANRVRNASEWLTADEWLDNHHNIELLLGTFDYAKRMLGDKTWQDLLKQLFSPRFNEVDTSSLSLARQVWRLGSQLILTTNFDECLKWSSPSPSFCRPLTRYNENALGELHCGPPIDPTIVHIHGSISDASKLVITQAEYNALYSDANAMVDVVTSIAKQTHLLFIGYGLRDREIPALLEYVDTLYRNGTPKHFAVLPEREAEELQRRGLKVHPIVYRDVSELPLILNELAKAASGVPARQDWEDSRPQNPQITNPSPGAPTSSTQKESRVSIKKLFEHYLVPEFKASNKSRSHFNSTRRATSLWSEFEHHCLADDTRDFIPVDELGARHLTAFDRWLAENHPRINKKEIVVNRVRAILNFAAEKQLIDSVPAYLGKSVDRSGDSAPVLLRSQVEAIWRAAEYAQWPRWDSDRNPVPWTPSDFWKAFIIMSLTYGLRTQEMVSFEVRFKPLLRKDVTVSDPVQDQGHTHYGWFKYVPQRQVRSKPAPIKLPLTKYAASALRRILSSQWNGSTRAFNCPRSSQSFYGVANNLIERAGLSEAIEKLPSCLRATARCYLDQHHPGIADHVLGTAPERDLSASIVGMDGKLVTVKEAFDQCFSTYDPFPCFAEVLDTPSLTSI